MPGGNTPRESVHDEAERPRIFRKSTQSKQDSSLLTFLQARGLVLDRLSDRGIVYVPHCSRVVHLGHSGSDASGPTTCIATAV